MLREMTSQQVDEWIAFYQIEPFGLAVLDNLMAHLKAIIAQIMTPKGKTSPRPDKFLLWPERRVKRVDAELDPQDDEEEWQQHQ